MCETISDNYYYVATYIVLALSTHLSIQAVDIVGQVSDKVSTAGQLRLMQWLSGYQQTLRGLGVQEVRDDDETAAWG